MPWIEKPQKKMTIQLKHVLMPAAKRVGIGVAAAALLVAVVIAVYAAQLG
jgi:phage-related minor tail protein